MTALHKESLIEYLADIPVELMPDVLVFIQRETDKIQSLSMMYAAMRWWHTPSLYVHRRRHKCFANIISESNKQLAVRNQRSWHRREKRKKPIMISFACVENGDNGTELLRMVTMGPNWLIANRRC